MTAKDPTHDSMRAVVPGEDPTGVPGATPGDDPTGVRGATPGEDPTDPRRTGSR